LDGFFLARRDEELGMEWRWPEVLRADTDKVVNKKEEEEEEEEEGEVVDKGKSAWLIQEPSQALRTYRQRRSRGKRLSLLLELSLRISSTSNPSA